MELSKNNIERLCSFYVNDWHLVTMLLPYINKQINEKANIITILGNNIEQNVKTLISKLNLKNEQEILKLDWSALKELKEEDITGKLKSLKENNIKNVVFISGNKTYIDIINQNVEKYMKEEKNVQDINIKIIDCYEVGEFNINMKAILEEHDKMLNTSGEKNINDVFDGCSYESTN